MDKKNNIYLFHGSSVKVINIDLSYSRLRTDFGNGFYMSSKLDAARAWALRAAGMSGTAYVVRYEIDKSVFTSDDIAYKRFDGATLEWLEFIRENRERKSQKNAHKGEPRHRYDIVSGLIADDQAADVVDRYCRGKLTGQESLDEIKFIPDVYQYSFHTEKSLSFVKAMDYQRVRNGKWDKWLSV